MESSRIFLMLAYRRSIDKVHVGQVQSSLAKIKYYVVLFFWCLKLLGVLLNASLLQFLKHGLLHLFIWTSLSPHSRNLLVFAVTMLRLQSFSSVLSFKLRSSCLHCRHSLRHLPRPHFIRWHVFCFFVL